MIRKVLTWVLIIFLVWFAASRPVSAAHAVKAVGHRIAVAADGFGTFCSRTIS